MVRMEWSGKPPEEPKPQKVGPPRETAVKVSIDKPEPVKITVKPQNDA